MSESFDAWTFYTVNTTIGTYTIATSRVVDNKTRQYLGSILDPMATSYIDDLLRELKNQDVDCRIVIPRELNLGGA